MITIINYGIGNLTSVKNMLKKAGAEDVRISNSPEEIAAAVKLLLPGVGHFDYGIKKLHESGLIPLLEKRVLHDKVPILGICLGAQLMTNRSDEGLEPGLGWIDAETVKFDSVRMTGNYKIPHMGWNYVKLQKQNVLNFGLPEASRFYFVHSYHLKMNNPQDEWLTAHYGYDFCAAYQKENIFACQFHPEKSHKFGMQLLKNFVAL
jgi:imidazole glycerol-phosphate synthase subunit HisH